MIERISINNFKLTTPKVNIATILNLLASKDLTPKTKNYIVLNINKALNEFGLADNIEIISDEKFAAQELRVKIKDLSSNIKDVGFGIALQLPIIVQTFLSEIGGGDTILVEQPEVHLHPKLQANFIKMLLTVGPKNTYFIETHSEHIVRILQVIVKNKLYGITSKDVTIHYFKRDEGKFSISNHNIKEDGRLSENFPSGFYDSSYMLAKELLS
jgi:predicted ATPase